MSLRVRLTAAFIAVLTLPMIVVTLLVRGAVRGELDERTAAELRAAHAAAPALYRAWQERAADLVREAARALGGRPIDDAFRDRRAAAGFTALARGSLGFLAVVARDGSVIGVAAEAPRLLPGAAAPQADAVVRERLAQWAVLAEAVVAEGTGSPGSLVGGFWLDRRFVDALAAMGGEVTVLVAGNAVATSGVRLGTTSRPALEARGPLLVGRFAGRDVVAVRSALVDGVSAERLAVLVTRARKEASGAARSIALGLWAVLGSAVVLGSAIAWLLSRVITKPLVDMASAAQAVARDDFSGRIDVRSQDEVGRLAAAFNEMTGHLRAHVGELERSRDEIRGSLRRLGEVLRSTHDLSKLLPVVLETAVVAVQAKAGAVYLLSASRGELYLKVGRNLDPSVADRRIPVGEGIAGSVAKARRPILIPSASEAPAFAEPEPHEPTVLAVPIESETQLVGVIALYGRNIARPFDASDLETMRSLARQAAVGVENVLLHQEAQRLSITDGLTGLWNYRYMQMRLSQEVGRADRFARSFSLLTIDIDRFKTVNDRFGHHRGDAVLVELARRIVAETRAQVDTTARYGGEEFVLILPETPLEGASVVAEKIRSSIAGEPFAGDGEEPLTITVSIGAACFPQHGSTPQILLRAADQAMYEAKARGRNCVATADELDSASSTPVADDQGRP